MGQASFIRLSTPPGGGGLKTSGVLARFQSASDGVSVYVAYTIGAQLSPPCCR